MGLLLFRVGCPYTTEAWHRPCCLSEETDTFPRRSAMGLDPVCGMEVTPVSAEAQSEYEGVTFYFCSEECKKAFDADPLAYLDEVDLAEARAIQESQSKSS
jgi:YHS domain-containing protein